MKSRHSLYLGLALVGVGGVASWYANAAQFGYSGIVANDNHIRATQNGTVVELVHTADTLVVATLPPEGFFGLRVGDVIVKVDGKDVTTTDSFTYALNTAKSDKAVFTVKRSGAQLELSVDRRHGFDRFI
jgi:S1-C subfamily serine protease